MPDVNETTVDDSNCEQEPTIKNIHLDFQKFVYDGIKKLNKGLVASLEYKKNINSHKIEFIFKQYNKGHNDNIKPQIEIKINKYNHAIDTRVIFEKTDNFLKFKSPEVKIHNFIIIATENNEDGDVENLLSRPDDRLDLPSVNKTDDNFLSFWFDSTPSENDKGQIETIKRERLIGADTEYSAIWENLKVDGTTSYIDNCPELPYYDYEKPGFVNDNELDVEWARFFIVVIVWRIILDILMVEKQAEAGDDGKKYHTGLVKKCSKSFADALFEFLPLTKDYRPKRPVDVNPHTVSDALIAENLEVPWHVVSSAVAALNAGKHIIFTGPPGCGKTHLAKLISQISSSKSPLMSTASQSWSTDEVIGRYMPNVDGTGLEFKYGFFLRALQNKKWLVIDEINRCDIDNCFGELFTVLSGQSVSLPFETKSDEDGSLKPIRVVVDSDTDTDADNNNYITISCRETFRLLATMNDADVAGLHQLSYALRRRFAIIRVDAPGDEKKRTIFVDRIESVFKDLELDTKKYVVNNSRANCMQTLKTQIIDLFARDNKEDGYDDLIDIGVVGIAPVLDIIRFVCEGLRAPDGGLRKINTNFKSKTDINATKAETQLLNSFLAMGIVLNVFPQLDAIVGEKKRFNDALKCILKAFQKEDVFLKIERKENVLELVGAPNLKDTPDLKIRGFLIQELRRQYSKDSSALGLITEIESSLQNNKTEKIS